MNCDELRDAVTEYLEESFPLREKLDCERHLAKCRGCRVYLHQIQSTISAVRHVPPAVPPAAMQKEVLAAFRSRRSVEAPRSSPASSLSRRVLAGLEATVRRRIGWASAGLALAASLLLLFFSGPSGEIDRPGLPAICLPVEVVAAIIPVLGVMAMCRHERRRIPPSAFGLVAGLGAVTGQMLLFFFCPMLDARAHALVFHAGGVVVALVIGTAFGYVPIGLPRVPSG